MIDLAALYQPHAGQALLHAADAKTKLLRIARRWGKSRFALWEMIKTYSEALDIAVPSSLVPPFHAWVVVPSFPQATQVWNEMLTFIPRDVIEGGSKGILQDEMQIRLLGSPERPWGLIEVKSAHDPENLQTAGLDFLWVSEAQDVKERSFEKLLPTLRSPGRMGRAVFEGIPSLWGDHWFQAFYARVERRGRREASTLGTMHSMSNALAFTATIFQRPELPEELREEIEEDREILRDSAWRRMYMATFEKDAGYFKNVDACIAGDLLPIPVPGRRYGAGLDLGRNVDFTVLYILDAVDRRVVHRRAWGADTLWPSIRSEVKDVCDAWEVERIIQDSSGMGGDMFLEELQAEGLPVEGVDITGVNRTPLLESLGLSLERETVHYPDIPELLRQLRMYQPTKLPSGKLRPDHPPGEHDDDVWALTLGLQACDAPQAVSPGGGRTRSYRYLPREGEGLARSAGARAMRQRHSDAIMERARLAGVQL